MSSLTVRGLTSRLRARLPEVAAALVVLIFLVVGAVWLALDQRFPAGDYGKHLSTAYAYKDALANGRLLEPFLGFTQYPPLVHFVGAIGLLAGSGSIASAVLAENLLFVPVLALGCYGVGRIAFDRRVGALAVIFALAVPMVISQFHVLMLDGPEAAMVALSLWLLLLSDRFRRNGFSILAGVAAGVGMYTKTTFAFFVVGVVAVMLLRGGWRQWRGFAYFAAAALLIAQPWYFLHLEQIAGMTSGAGQEQIVLWYGSVPYPEALSLQDFAWYWWSMINNQLYLPLALLFVIGVGYGVWRSLRDKSAAGFYPELLVGGLCAYVGITWISLNDPRYTLPGLVYFAVLGTAWMVRLRRFPRWVAVGTLVALLLVNTVTLNTGLGGTVRADLPNAVESPIGEWRFTVFSEVGYLQDGSAPDTVGSVQRAMLDVLREASDDGVQNVYFQAESLNNGGWTLSGLAVFAQIAQLTVPTFYGVDAARIGPHEIYVWRQLPSQVAQEPCLVSPADDTAIFMVRGTQVAEEPSRPYCPPR